MTLVKECEKGDDNGSRKTAGVQTGGDLQASPIDQEKKSRLV
jgi:hypothetical protein